MDKLQALEVFVAVAEAESFAGGARAVGLSAPSATRGINALEDRLGARLFSRTTRVVRLTDEGRAYLEEVRAILADLKAADDALSGAVENPKGLLRITTPVEFGRLHVTPIVAEYLERFPDVDASVLMLDRVVNLVDEGLDVGVRIGPLTTAGLTAIRVGRIRRVVCGSPDYFAKNGLPQTPADLADHRLIGAASVTSASEWRFGKQQEHVIRVKPRLTVSSIAAAVEIARQGWGLVSVLSYQIGPELRVGSLQTVLEEYEPDHMPIHLVHYSGRRVPAKVRGFLDLARERLRKSPVLN